MKIVILTIGNPLKTDDNISNLVGLELKKEGFNVYISETQPENFISVLRKADADTIIFIDAMEFGGDPGAVHIYDFEDLLTDSFSTHSVPVNMIKEYFSGKEIYCIGIQPKSVYDGQHLTHELQKKFKEIVEKVLEKIKDIVSLEGPSFL